MTENKTYTVELTDNEIGLLLGAVYSYKGEGSEKMIAAASKLIKAHIAQVQKQQQQLKTDTQEENSEMMQDMNLTELEQQWIKETYDDGTGYLDNSRVNMDPKVERGVISSLIKKGIIESDHDPDRAEMFGIDTDLFATPKYEHLF